MFLIGALIGSMLLVGTLVDIAHANLAVGTCMPWYWSAFACGVSHPRLHAMLMAFYSVVYCVTGRHMGTVHDTGRHMRAVHVAGGHVRAVSLVGTSVLCCWSAHACHAHGLFLVDALVGSVLLVGTCVLCYYTVHMAWYSSALACCPNLR